MKISEKVRLLLTNPGMPGAYLNWCLYRLGGRKPRRSVDTSQPDVSVGEWISFSEYWSYYYHATQSERDFIERMIGGGRQPATVIDVGANVGLFTCWLGACGHRVHSFEPIPETFCRLAKNVAHNKLTGKVVLNCMAVGEKSGIVQFEVQDNSPGTNRIATGKTESPRNVPCITIDEYCEALGLDSIDFLKIDVEGMEPGVLRGASMMMKKSAIGAMLVEVCPWNLRHVGLSPTLLHETIIENGYEAFAIEEDGRPGARLAASDLDAMELENIAVLPKD
jgi:FkbM family methyltransferase